MTRVDSAKPTWTAAVRKLRGADPVLATVIERVGPCRLALDPAENPFMALASCIVSQQLSGKAAATIFGRFQGLYPRATPPTPKQVLRTPVEKLRSAGLSGAKTAAIHDLARRIADGLLPVDELGRMDDEAVIQTLSSVRGIGRWSAEMYLIFRLGRPDVLPVGDLGLRKGVQRAYGLEELPKPVRLEQIAHPWKPYRSIATWYFWASLDAKAEAGA